MGTAATAWVTGASRGIGRAIALDLARAGWDVVVTYQSRHDAALAVVHEIEALGRKATAVALDVSKGPEAEAIVTKLVEERGCPDALVNNAGITKDGMFAMMSRASWDEVI